MKTHLSKKWFLTRNVTEKNMLAIPKGCTEFALTGGKTDLERIAGKGKEECIIYQKFELKEETLLGFGIGCDWWHEAFFNGKKVSSTMRTGNQTAAFSSDNHKFIVQGKKGTNLLAIRVKRGSGGWLVCFDERDPVASDPCAPLALTLDPSRSAGPVKIMNAVNNGPIRARSDQTRGNFLTWQKLDIPYARNHDAAFCSSYGGEHSVDISAVFPDFSADADDPGSYDFVLTDKYVLDTLAAGTQTFYRLGTKIEHNIKKYGTRVPPDFRKWAVICEHIIRHYNEGWAKGHHLNMIYWEIWNEPDLSDTADDKKTWQGTPEQFFDFYRTAACHLKKCFPKLRIGGPALAGNLNWMKRFLKSMTAGKRVPIDFFSWHSYSVSPCGVAGTAQAIRGILDEFGYTKAESILNEWNYVRGWAEDWIYSLRMMTGLKGAVFTSSTMCACQEAPVDMLMYYDARPCGMNGLFDQLSLEPIKGYYSFLAWKLLRDLKKTFKIDTKGKEGIYACGASDGKKTRVLLCRFFEEDDLPGPLEVTIGLKNGNMMGTKLMLLDETHDLAEVPYFTTKKGGIRFELKANTLVMLEF